MIVREGHEGILTWLGRHVATRDDVPVKMKAVVQLRVVDSESVLFKVQDYIRVTK